MTIFFMLRWLGVGVGKSSVAISTTVPYVQTTLSKTPLSKLSFRNGSPLSSVDIRGEV